MARTVGLTTSPAYSARFVRRHPSHTGKRHVTG